VPAVPDLDTIAAFALASLALLLIPGPAVIYVLNRSVADGRTIGLAAVAGLELGTFVHVLAAALGLSAVLAASATAFTVVKWAGAAYLVWIGVRTMMLRPVRLDGPLPQTTVRRAFGQGVVVNALNPKIALFFLSFLPQFIEPGDGASWLQALVLGLVFVVIALVTDGTYALAASALRNVLVRGRTLPFVQRWVAGVIYIGLGVMAATTGRSVQNT
jgi:threonine/homoserine/homoserine lactone efflux protein